MGNLLFKNAHVIDPSQKLDTVGDVLVVDGKIADFGKALSCSADNIIDASGLVLAPGLIDLHVHLRDPGLEYRGYNFRMPCGGGRRRDNGLRHA